MSAVLITSLPRVSIGVMAYNEETHIAPAIRCIQLQSQENFILDEILVVVSNSTDGTEGVVRRLALEDKRIRLIIEPVRRGKIFSVKNYLSQARNEFCVVMSADVFADRQCLDQLLVAASGNSAIGMIGPRVLTKYATNRPTFAFRLNRVLWDMHHELALISPKLGELVMVRKSFIKEISTVAGCDEVMMEASVINGGGVIAYCPTAVVSNYSMSRVAELFTVRRRIHIQHLTAQRLINYKASSLGLKNALKSLHGQMMNHPSDTIFTGILCAFEILARVHARIKVRSGENSMIWEPTHSARQRMSEGEA